MNTLTLVQNNEQLATIEEQLKGLATNIRDCHKDVLHGARISVEAARRAGELLVEAKELVQHGQWTTWVKEHCRFSDRTAQSYMRVARRWDEERIPSLRAITLERALDLLAEPKITTEPEPKPQAPADLPAGDPEVPFELQPELLEPTGPGAHTDLIADQKLLMVAKTIRGYTVQDAIVKRSGLLDLRDAIDAALRKAEHVQPEEGDARS